MPPKRKFATVSASQLETYRHVHNAKRTEYCTKSAENGLREYYQSLPKSSSSKSYDELTASELNNLLESYYVACRTGKDEQYKTSSLRTLRQNLRRAIRSTHNLDILNNNEFASSNIVFNNRLVDNKKCGLGVVNHHPDISPSDLKQIVEKLSPEDPAQLQLLVWFYIQLHFCRRGQENLDTTEKDHFNVVTINGKRCLVQAKDELTKNHRESDATRANGAIIPEQGHSKCPVALYEKYVSKLSSDSKYLWQLPRQKMIEPAKEGVWYERKAGKNTISQYMKRISSLCGLSKVHFRFVHL